MGMRKGEKLTFMLYPARGSQRSTPTKGERYFSLPWEGGRKSSREFPEKERGEDPCTGRREERRSWINGKVPESSDDQSRRGKKSGEGDKRISGLTSSRKQHRKRHSGKTFGPENEKSILPLQGEGAEGAITAGCAYLRESEALPTVPGAKVGPSLI